MRIQLLLATNDSSCQSFFQQGLRFYQHLFRLEICNSIDELLQRSFTIPYNLIILDSALRATPQFPILLSKKAELREPLLVTVEREQEILFWRQYFPDTEKIIVRSPRLLKQLPFLLQTIFQKEQIFRQRATEREKTARFPGTDSGEEAVSGFCLLDQKYRFISVHPKISKMLGYSENELLALSLDDLIHPEQFVSYQHWLSEAAKTEKSRPFLTSLFTRSGDIIPAKLQYQPYRNAQDELLHYQMEIQFLSQTAKDSFSRNGHIDQLKMVTEISNIMRAGRDKSLHGYLESIARLAATLFKFHRITLALLDRRRGAFLKQIMLGYSTSNGHREKVLEIPQAVIRKIFEQKYNVRVIYRNKQLDRFQLEPFSLEERRLQAREDGNSWDPNNVIILNLSDQKQNSFGYISMDQPIGRFSPQRNIFHNLELYSKLASLAIENFYQYASLEKRTRRLKRLLITGNIFKLALTGTEVMREMVWSIRFSLDFQLVMLGIIDPKSKKVIIKSVSCHDHVKTLQLQDLTIPLDQLKNSLNSHELIGSAVLTRRPDDVFQPMKNIYYDNKFERSDGKSWNWWHTLIVPVPGANKSPLGYLFVDDPADSLLPSREIIQTLEIFAQQLSIALNNRYLYLQEKKKLETLRQRIAAGSKSASSKTQSWLKDILFR
ncbi:MAG: PAS domain S-box protein [Calditrichaeota bacterium]|nr:PAS domain S-box protein [Calditrichota bacterium]